MNAARHARPHRGARLRLGVVLHRWHRRIGLAAGLFLFWLAASGIALNQSAALHLDAVHVSWPWLMRCYGLNAQPPSQGWDAGGHWLVAAEGQLLLDGRALQPPVASPLGTATAGGLIYLAGPDAVTLLEPDGTRVDELRAPPLPTGSIRRIGQFGAQVALELDSGVYASADGETWQPVPPGGVQWSVPQALPPAAQEKAFAALRPSLPLSRVLADAHSGRIFGAGGAAVIDAVGLGAMLLVVSGLWLFGRGARRHRQDR